MSRQQAHGSIPYQNRPLLGGRWRPGGQDEPSHAPQMKLYTGATFTAYATTTLRAGQEADGGEGLVT
jgi:hypothetical protein